METIREYASKVGHQVVGRLTRHPEWEYQTNSITGERKHSGCRHYSDEGGNEYIVGKKGIAIVDAEGAVI